MAALGPHLGPGLRRGNATEVISSRHSVRFIIQGVMIKHDSILPVSEARQRLRELMDRVTNDKTPAVITRRGGEPVVMVSLSEWEAIQETQHLLRSPANARRLRTAIDAAEAGETRALTPGDLARLGEEAS